MWRVPAQALRAVQAAVLAAVLAGAAPAALAGRSCEPQKLTARTLENGLAMAAQTLQALQASGEKVVLLARSGQDLTRYGLRYSHAAFAYQVTDAAGHLKPLEQIEGEMIRLAIEKYDGHMSEVARRLGIGRSTLYRKVRDLGLEVRSGEME